VIGVPAVNVQVIRARITGEGRVLIKNKNKILLKLGRKIRSHLGDESGDRKNETIDWERKKKGAGVN